MTLKLSVLFVVPKKCAWISCGVRFLRVYGGLRERELTVDNCMMVAVDSIFENVHSP